MKRFASAAGATVLLLSLLLGGGCEEDSSNEPPVGPDITGEWSGRYYVEDGSADLPIDASITQNGRATFIQTSLPGPGRLLSGELNGAGHLFMTDAFDGETWTTWQAVSGSHIRLLDFAYGPGTSLRVIELTR